LLGIVAAEVLEELVSAIENRSTDRALGLVHRLLAEGQNLQQFCREAISHFRNLLVARVCGADSDLIAAPAEERPKLARAAAAFSEEDLTRFFQFLLITEDDLRRKPDPRLHMEMGLLKLVNAARLAPLEELLAQISGNAPSRPPVSRPSADVVGPNAAASGPAPLKPATEAVPVGTPAPSTMKASSPQPIAPVNRPAPPPVPVISNDSNAGAATGAAPALERGETPTAGASAIGLEPAQVNAIKAQSFAQTQFLGELLESAMRWELEAGEIRVYFPTERRALADLLQSRDRIEKLRTIVSGVLGQPVRVCVKLESSPAIAGKIRVAESDRELRARFEQDPIVRTMVERFGGRISEVKRRGEG
jgi:DNA polymerase-3 subunit gamma/tau